MYSDLPPLAQITHLPTAVLLRSCGAPACYRLDENGKCRVFIPFGWPAARFEHIVVKCAISL